MAEHEAATAASEPVAEAARPPPSEAGAPLGFAAAPGSAAMVGALRRAGPRAAADVLLRLQRQHGNAVVAASIARAPAKFATVEEEILDEILHGKRPERLRELFESVPAAKAEPLATRRLAAESKDAMGIRFNADLPADLREQLLAILRRKYEPAPPAAAPAPTDAKPTDPSALFEFEDDPDDPSTLRSVVTSAKPNYVDRRVSQVARALGGADNTYLLFLDGVEIPQGVSVLDLPGLLQGKPLPVKLEPWQLGTDTSSAAVQEAPFKDPESALAAVGGRPGHHAYYKAVLGLIVPTVFSPATTPRIMAMIAGVERERAAEGQAAAEQFTIMAVAMGAGLAGGAALEGVLTVALRPKAAPGKAPPAQSGAGSTEPAGPGPGPGVDDAPPTVRTPKTGPAADPDATPPYGTKAPFLVDHPIIEVGPEISATWAGDDRAVVRFSEAEGGGVTIGYINAGDHQGQGAKLLGSALRKASQQLNKPGLARPAYLDSSNVVNQTIKPMMEEGRQAEARTIVRRASGPYARELGGTAGEPQLTMGDDGKVVVKVPITY